MNAVKNPNFIHQSKSMEANRRAANTNKSWFFDYLSHLKLCHEINDAMGMLCANVELLWPCLQVTVIFDCVEELTWAMSRKRSRQCDVMRCMECELSNYKTITVTVNVNIHIWAKVNIILCYFCSFVFQFMTRDWNNMENFATFNWFTERVSLRWIRCSEVQGESICLPI